MKENLDFSSTIAYWDFQHFGGWISSDNGNKVHCNFHLGKVKSYPRKVIHLSTDICDGYIFTSNSIKGKNSRRKVFDISVGKGWIKFRW